MNTKENFEPKKLSFEKPTKTQAKPKSFRPMNSMVKVRSFKPKTAVAAFVKTDEVEMVRN